MVVVFSSREIPSDDRKMRDNKRSYWFSGVLWSFSFICSVLCVERYGFFKMQTTSFFFKNVITYVYLFTFVFFIEITIKQY